MKPLTRYDAPYAPMQADPNGDWYAKDEADAVIRHYQDEALCAEEAAMTHAQRVHELEAERDAARADAERMRGHMRYFVDNDFNRVRKQRDQAYTALERIAGFTLSQFHTVYDMADACVHEAVAVVGEQE